MASKVFLRATRALLIGLRFVTVLPGVISLVCPFQFLVAAEPTQADCCGGEAAANSEAAPPGVVAVAKAAPPPAPTEFFKSSDPRVRPHGGRISLKNLDLTRPPDEQELIASGQLGSPLSPSRSADPEKQSTAAKKVKQKQDNHLFGRAMQKWNEHRYDEALQIFQQHRAEFADSPWAGEAQLHLGCQAQFSGNWNSARASFESILSAHKKGDDIWQKAKLRRAVLNYQQAELDDSSKAFGDMLKSETSWERRTYAQTMIRQVNQTKKNLAASKVCGPECLAFVLRDKGELSQAESVLSGPAPSEMGYSLGQLANLAIDSGLETTAVAIPVDALKTVPVPFIAHYTDRHFVVVTGFTDTGACLVFEPRLSRTTELEVSQFTAQWSGKAIVFGAIPNDARLASVEELNTEVGGCCGLPRYPDDLGNDCPMDCNGLPKWQVNPVNMNLVVQDVPMWHESAIGPDFEVRITYNSQDSLNQYRPFGNKWPSNFSTYAVESPAQGGPGEVLIVMPNGRGYTFAPAAGGGYTQAADNFNTLTKTAAYSFDLRMPDGLLYRYGPPTAGSTSSLLLAIIDRHNLQLTIVYDSNGQIDYVQDADGSVFQFDYNAAGFVSRVQDPWGRYATFSYNTSGDLIGQRDMGGLLYSYSYDADKYLTSIGKPSGTYLFYVEPAHDSPNGEPGNDSNAPVEYPAPGGAMWSNYRITITDPLGYKEEYFYDGFTTGGGAGVVGIGWHRDKRQYLTPINTTSHATILSAPKTTFEFVRFGGSTGKGVISRTTFADTDYIVRDQFTSAGLPGLVANKRGSVEYFTYNSSGRVLTHIDGEYNKRTYTYENGADLKTVLDPWDRLVAELTYHATTRDLEQIVEHVSATESRTTTLTYNTVGQVETVTDAANNLFTLEYYPSTHGTAPRRLKTVHRGTITGASLGLLTYDAKGRVQTCTDADGFTVTLTYDDLDRITDASYPDGTSERTEWGCCVVKYTKDRAGKVTNFGCDPVNRLIRQRDARGVETQFRYDPNGNLVKLIDGAGHVTRWTYDGRNRVETKIYADTTTNTFHYDRDVLEWQLNGRNQKIDYLFDGAGNNYRISNSSVPTINFQFDKLNLPKYMYDGYATTNWTRNWLGEVTDITVTKSGDWTDTIHYDYDALGRQTGRTVNGASESIVIDDLDRTTKITNALGVFDITYQSAVSQLLDTVAMTGGPSTVYGWHPTTQNQRLKEIWNKAPGGATLSKFNYEYTTDGQIKNWRREGLSTGEATEFAFQYDPAGQLLNGVLRGVTSQNVVQSHGYGYDAASNRTKEIVGTAFTEEAQNNKNLNQLATRGNGTVLPIRGKTNEPVSSVTINGQAAKISGGDRFEGTANVTAGNNTVTVSATDYGQPPNTTSKQYQVTVAAGATDSLTYDDSGNLLTGGGRTYEWDALERLTAVIVGTQRTEFVYDGLGRRVKVIEKTNGTVTATKRFVHDGLDIAEERDNSNNAITKRYFGTGMEVPTGTNAGHYIYTRDHLGSIREVWKTETASLSARYDYDPYGRRTALNSGGIDSDFGFTGHSLHLGTGLTLAPFRAYDANLGRRLSRDPLGEASDVNLYGYVFNDPINLWDPYGLEARVKLTEFSTNLFSDVVNFGAGFGDNWTFGATKWARESILGDDDPVNKCSGSYKGGEFTSLGVGIALGGKGFLNASKPLAGKGFVQAHKAFPKGKVWNEFSHFIPGVGPHSKWFGNRVSGIVHSQIDPSRWGFLKKGFVDFKPYGFWKKWAARFPDALAGALAAGHGGLQTADMTINGPNCDK